MANILKFENIYNYFKNELLSVRDELLAANSLTELPLEMSSIYVRYNGGDLILNTDYTITNRTITIINENVVTADCLLYKDGGIELVKNTEYTVSGNVITVSDGSIMTAFDMNLFDNVGNYLTGLPISEVEDYVYINNGVIENLGIELIDTRVLTYMQTVGITLTSSADYRHDIMLLMEKFASSQQDLIISITDTETYDLHIRCTQMPDYTQNYKAHGLEEFNTSLIFDIRISQSLDSANEEELYINSVLIPYSTLYISKATETEADLRKNNYIKFFPKVNTETIKIIGFSYQNNDSLQALKSDIRNPDTFNGEYIVQLKRGVYITDFDIDGRTIELTDTTLDTSKLLVFDVSTLLTLDTDYSISENVITILDADITMADLVLLYGDYAFLNTYDVILTDGTVTNTYGSPISYDVTFQMKRS